MAVKRTTPWMRLAWPAAGTTGDFADQIGLLDVAATRMRDGPASSLPLPEAEEGRVGDGAEHATSTPRALRREARQPLHPPRRNWTRRQFLFLNIGDLFGDVLGAISLPASN